MTHSEILDSFVATFAFGDRKPISLDDLHQVEKELKTLLPSNFVDFAVHFGTVHTPDILDLVTGGESEIAPPCASFDVQDFFSAKEILETTRSYRSAGMDDWLVAVASDCMGNVFGFRAHAGSERPSDATLYIFDHDFCKTSEEAESFDSWLKSFLDMKKDPEP